MHAIFGLLLQAVGLSCLVSSVAGQVDHHAIHERDGARQGAGCARTDCSSATAAPAVLTGRVFLPDGEPAIGAVVLTSAGGQCVTTADGSFELEVDVPLEAESVQVTAVAAAHAGARHLVASTGVAWLGAAWGTTSVGRLVLASTSSCQPTWLPTFGGEPGVSGGAVEDLAVFDDGSGAALHAGGSFVAAGGVAALGVAKWNGTGWSALGSGMDESVFALAVFDDGSGDALYAGGEFTAAGGVTANRIAKWNGTSWSALGSGMDDAVYALTVFDDGSGPALYAGGFFTTAGGSAASRIAKWNGSSWSALGSGVSLGTFHPTVNALAVFDDGSGEALYAGGDFTSAGGVAASEIAKWNGTTWSALGSGMDDVVLALAGFGGGSGPELYAGGWFTTAGGVLVNRIAKWNGTSWAALESGIAGTVSALTAFDDGGGDALYAGGGFAGPVGVPATSIAQWDGTSWSALAIGIKGDHLALTVFDDGSGDALYAGGDFNSAGGVLAGHIAKRNGTSWSPLGSGVIGGPLLPFSKVLALTVFDDGSGAALVAGGDFTFAGGVAANYIAKWNGTSWSALGSGMGSSVYALAVFDDGSGDALYAGGYFLSAGGLSAKCIAKWNGTTWSPLGHGMSGGLSTSIVRALTVFDDGSGPALYAGGDFTIAGGAAANHIAKWNGTTWTALGSGMNSPVYALTVFDDGSGPALYAGGRFGDAGGVSASLIARWDGASWSALGSGMSGGFESTVHALTVFDDGGGDALYAGGFFTAAGGVAASAIARWDGASWSALGSGMGPSSSFPSVAALTVFNDGGGEALFAGGDFATSPAGDSYLAKWGCPAISSVPGCAGNPAKLAAQAPCAPLGAPLPLLITGSAATSGVGLVYFGAPGFDADGCGTVLPGLGELLLALTPTPIEIASGVLTGGTCALAPTVPSFPALRGFTVHLQGAAVQLVAPVLVEPTNALAVTLGP